VSSRALSIVVPAFNEEKRLGPSLDRILAFCPDAQIIVVDDGSRDRTEQVARDRGVRVERHAENRGKGFSLRVGMLAASGNRILMTDADLSTPIEELPHLEAQLDRGVDLAIGSRKMPGARLLRRQSLLRETLGKGFTFLSQLALGVRVRDFTCGFKLFTRDSARHLFSKLTVDRWGYDSELLFLAGRRGYRIVEVPVTWTNDLETRVRLGADVVQSLADLARIRLNAFLGRY
jgi:glycosyltransferase involved in cell wall biosynthesis